MTKETEVLVAPQEIRDLLSRLTEYRVESIPVDEPRTLAGLSLNTGIPVGRLQTALRELRGEKPERRLSWVSVPIVAFLLVGSVALAKAKTEHAVTPPAAAPAETYALTGDPQMEGLVPLTNVTYGPDAGTSMVDPTFEPSTTPPDGVGFYATVGRVLWGAGDRLKVARREPLSSADTKILQNNLAELLVKVRESATKRKLSMTRTGSVDQFLNFDGPGFATQLVIETYSGSSTVALRLPPVGSSEKDAQRVIKRSVARVIDELQTSLRWQAKVTQGVGPID